MAVIDAIDEKKYGQLLAKYLPGVIRIDGKRQINTEHARRLSRRFGLPLAMFIR